MKKIIITSFLFVSVLAFALDIDLSAIKDQMDLHYENHEDVANAQLDPSKTDAEAAGMQNLKKDANNKDSVIYNVVRIEDPMDAEKAELEKSLSGITSNGLDASWIQEPTDNFTANIAEGMVNLWASGEILEDSLSYISGLNINRELNESEMEAMAEQILAKARIFGANSLSCYTPYVGLNKCISAKVSYKYQCNETGNSYKDYNSCSNACGDSICKKFTDYNDPQLLVMGVDFSTVAGITNSDKKLAVAKALNQCRKTGTSGKYKKYGFTKVKVGNYHNYCCYDSVTSMELSSVLKKQLGLNTTSCDGIPLQRLEELDWNDPAVIAVMEKQTGNVLDTTMLTDFTKTFQNQTYEEEEANDYSNSINSELNKRKIPGI